MKQFFCILLILSMMLTLLVACDTATENNNSKDESTPTAEISDNSDTEESDTESQPPVDPYEHLRGMNFDGSDVTFLVIGDQAARYKSVEIMQHESNPDVINDAIKARNLLVENLLGVKIKEVRMDSGSALLTAARNDVIGDGTYDILMPYMPDAATLAAEGCLINLKSKDEIIKLDRPYWDQRANSDLSFANKLYFSTGDFSLLTFDCTHAIVFNKTLAETCNADNFYQLLKEDKWTFDALLRNAKKATRESNGVDGMTYEDTWGFFVNSGYATTLFMGSGERLTTKNVSDIPALSVSGDRAATVAAKIRDIFKDNTSTIVIESYSVNTSKDSDVYSAASRATAEGRALFRALAIVDLKDLDSFEECSYGILPTPKYNEEQDGYYNIVSAILASCACIHTNVHNEDMSAAVLEALAISSTETIRSAYYNNILKGRRIPDEDGEEALDVIFNNRVYELATIYNLGTISSLLYTCASSATDIWASEIERIQDNVTNKINELVETYDNYND